VYKEAVRRAAATPLAALALAGCGGGGAEELLPDLLQTEPRALEVFTEDGRDLLTFISAVDNVGTGPLVLESRRPSVDEPKMSIRQLVRRDDGSEAAYAVAGEVRYVDSETHRHWHVLRFERYELRALDGRLVAPDRKTGFCLGDRYDTHRDERIPGEPEDPVWIGECGRGQPERLVLRQGLSPGFGDDYVPRLEGQYVDVTEVPEGRYRLVHRVNVDRALRESDYTNNSASVVVVIERVGGTVRARAV
jgi:hypothetical protein